MFKQHPLREAVMLDTCVLTSSDSTTVTILCNAAEMGLNSKDVWGHFAPMFHLVDAFAIFAITLVGGRHAILPIFSAQAALSAIGALHNHAYHAYTFLLFTVSIKI